MKGVAIGALGGFLIMGVAFAWLWAKERFGPRQTLASLLDPRFRDR